MTGLGSPFSRLWAVVPALAAAALLSIGWGQSWEDIRKAAGAIRSVEADFIQEKHLKILARPLAARGKFWFRMPGSLRWEYQSPLKSVLLMSGGVTRRFVNTGGEWAADDASRLQAMQVVIGEITRWLNGDFDGNPDFRAALTAGGEIVLTPKSEGIARIIEKIVLKLAPTPGVIDSVTIHEGPDAFTQLTFVNPALNAPIADSVFERVE